MECPVCKEEARLFAKVDPNGLIGCFCENCKKCYVTKDPEQGWKEHLKIRYNAEAVHDLKAMHNVDAKAELLAAMELEFGMEFYGKNYWPENE
jgi:hypothetical protein